MPKQHKTHFKPNCPKDVELRKRIVGCSQEYKIPDFKPHNQKGTPLPPTPSAGGFPQIALPDNYTPEIHQNPYNPLIVGSSMIGMGLGGYMSYNYGNELINQMRGYRAMNRGVSSVSQDETELEDLNRVRPVVRTARMTRLSPEEMRMRFENENQLEGNEEFSDEPRLFSRSGYRRVPTNEPYEEPEIRYVNEAGQTEEEELAQEQAEQAQEAEQATQEMTQEDVLRDLDERIGGDLEGDLTGVETGGEIGETGADLTANVGEDIGEGLAETALEDIALEAAGEGAAEATGSIVGGALLEAIPIFGWIFGTAMLVGGAVSLGVTISNAVKGSLPTSPSETTLNETQTKEIYNSVKGKTDKDSKIIAKEFKKAIDSNNYNIIYVVKNTKDSKGNYETTFTKQLNDEQLAGAYYALQDNPNLYKGLDPNLLKGMGLNPSLSQGYNKSMGKNIYTQNASNLDKFWQRGQAMYERDKNWTQGAKIWSVYSTQIKDAKSQALKSYLKAMQLRSAWKYGLMPNGSRMSADLIAKNKGKKNPYPLPPVPAGYSPNQVSALNDLVSKAETANETEVSSTGSTPQQFLQDKVINTYVNEANQNIEIAKLTSGQFGGGDIDAGVGQLVSQKYLAGTGLKAKILTRQQELALYNQKTPIRADQILTGNQNTIAQFLKHATKQRAAAAAAAADRSAGGIPKPKPPKGKPLKP